MRSMMLLVMLSACTEVATEACPGGRLVVHVGSDDNQDGFLADEEIAQVLPGDCRPDELSMTTALDDYAEECHGGDMEACDDLYRESPRSSAYELYGGTCAGRQPNADASKVYCVDAFPPAS